MVRFIKCIKTLKYKNHKNLQKSDPQCFGLSCVNEGTYDGLCWECYSKLYELYFTRLILMDLVALTATKFNLIKSDNFHFKVTQSHPYLKPFSRSQPIIIDLAYFVTTQSIKK